MTVPGDTTVDAFHRGRFALVQPASGGHRAGMDAMLLAACVPDGFEGLIADLGAGAGAAGLAVLSRCPGTLATLVELDPHMNQCARETLQLTQNAQFSGRVKVICADVSLSGDAREDAGLTRNTFDFVIANPPFNNPRDRRTPHETKALAHVMDDGLLEAWTRTAAAIAKPGCKAAFIVRPQSLKAILEAFDNRFGGIGIRPVLPRPGADAIRILVTGIKGSRAPLEVKSPVVLHPEGSATALTGEADRLVNGVAGLGS